MTVEEAIVTALEYEERVRDVYYENAKKFRDATARKIFQVLAEEEQHHIDYLERKLEEWKESGTITLEKLETIVPDEAKIESHVNELKSRAKIADYGDELEMFKKALALEVATSNYYKEVVNKLPVKEQELFHQFIEIEEGHEMIVQAEIDAANGLGFWFDFMEFGLEGE